MKETANDTASLPLADRLRNDAACDRFEADWRAGNARPLTDYLEDATGAARAVRFRELLALELDLRRSAGEAPELDNYRARYPDYSAAVVAVFHATAASGAGRRSRDGTATEGGAGPDFTWGPAADPVASLLQRAGYRIEAEIGRGGMGVVYRAYHSALDRTVALKVIRSAGFASESERLRFQNEAEAVAQLDHPQIVPIFEVGEVHGLHYFSMKLIQGTSLDRRLVEFGQDVRATAELVAVVAEAIHHAHQRGILHRDLKPANILVDQDGLPHVTDFGLARRIEGDGDLTHSGAIVGTPSYMSPEQATGMKGSLTTATDVYGLGAILYALLTGTAPHQGSSYVDVLDSVRNTPAEPPSRRNQKIPRDLEVICLKCLEKEPERRYPSAQALADDLLNWLAGRPITARPVSTFRRGWMWCRRHPLPASLAALLVISVAAGLSGVAWKWREADRERINYAAIDDFLARMIAESSTEVNPHAANLTVREMLDRAASQIGGDFQGRPEVEAAVRERIGRAYLSRGAFAKAEPMLRTAIRIDTDALGAEHPVTLRATNALADLLAGSGHADQAEVLLRANLGVSSRVLGPDAEPTLDAESRLGVLLSKQQKWQESEPLLRHALDARRRVLRAGHPDTLRSIHELCQLLVDQGRYADAEPLAEEYERGIRCARGPKHPDNVAALQNRGLIRILQGKPAEAEPFYRQAVEEAQRILGPDHRTTEEAVSEHAKLLRSLEKPPGTAPRSTAAPPASGS